MSARVLISLVGLALLASGCDGTGFRYVKNEEKNLYFKVPEEWTLYDDRPGLEQTDPLTAAQGGRRAATWDVLFDAAPQPDVEHLDRLLDTVRPTEHPVGFAAVHTLSDPDRDRFSLAVLRNAVFNLDEGEEKGAIQMRERYDLTTAGLHGSRFLFDVKTKGGPVRINQTGLIDDTTENVYLLVVACGRTCYTENEAVIEEVIASWTVEDD